VNLLVKATSETLSHFNPSVIDVFYVPGAYELPLAAQHFSLKYDVVIAIGVLIKGETAHFEVIADAVANGLMTAQLNTKKPIIFGVLTCLNHGQARDRAGWTSKQNLGVEWAISAAKMVALFRQ
jgi:6,7-dimethyl-8-ribityllumazine synthase